jgi:hypothetical protein
VVLLKGNRTWTGYRDLFVAADSQRSPTPSASIEGLPCAGVGWPRYVSARRGRQRNY